MKKFHILLISFLVYFESVVFAEYEKEVEMDTEEEEEEYSAAPKAEFRAHFKDEKMKDDPKAILDTFDSSLAEIQKFAQHVKPITSDIRLSINSRRALNEDIFFNAMRTTANKLIDVAEIYAPSAKSFLHVPRTLVEMFLTD